VIRASGAEDARPVANACLSTDLASKTRYFENDIAMISHHVPWPGGRSTSALGKEVRRVDALVILTSQIAPPAWSTHAYPGSLFR